MSDEPLLGRNGGLRRKGERSSTRSPKGGTNRKYILARLKRDGYQTLLQAVLDRRLSPFGAGCLAGYFKRRRTISAPSDDRRSHRPQRIDVRCLIA